MAKTTTTQVCGARHWKHDKVSCTLEPHAVGDHVHEPSRTEFQKTR